MILELPYVAVANLSDFGEGALKMVRVGNRRICLVRLSTGVQHWTTRAHMKDTG
jgi:hypothetical protein